MEQGKARRINWKRAAMAMALLAMLGTGLTIGTLILVISSPLLLLFSPILVPLGFVLFMAAAAFAAMVAAGNAVAWIYRYKKGRHPMGSDKLDAAIHRFIPRRDIIDLVREDHAKLEEDYSNYKSASRRGDHYEARKWFNQFVWEISRHSVSEELVMYPLLDGLGPKGRDLAYQSRADHHKIKELLTELQRNTESEDFDSRMETMMSNLREHIKLEEKRDGDLACLRDNMDQQAREAAGATFALGKNLVPTRPHTAVPEKPAALEAALGLLVTPIDKLRDVFTPFPRSIVPTPA